MPENHYSSLLFNKEEMWKKNNGTLFDVIIGPFDGAEICELVGLFLLNEISDLLPMENIGLYWDDGFAIIRNASGPEMEQTRKKLIKIFHKHNLKITAETNLTHTDFVDINLNLTTGTFSPYRKPNDNPLYINIQSNHPPFIKKQLPQMISNRISELSSNESIFNRSSRMYTEALKKKGYQEKIEFKDTTLNDSKTNAHKRCRKRKVIWFNPPV